HPAVLRLIAQTVEGAKAHGRSVSVCGGLASDVQAVPVLLGLGIACLSAAPAMVAEVKAAVRSLQLPACQDLAPRALAQTSAAEVRALSIDPPKRRARTAGVSA